MVSESHSEVNCPSSSRSIAARVMARSVVTGAASTMLSSKAASMTASAAGKDSTYPFAARFASERSSCMLPLMSISRAWILGWGRGPSAVTTSGSPSSKTRTCSGARAEQTSALPFRCPLASIRTG